MRTHLIALALVSAGAAGLAVLSGLAPWLYDEDGLIEWATALVFLAVFLLGTRRLLASAGTDRAASACLGFATGLGLVCFLDEISFGERLIGFVPPRLLDENIDGVHDVLAVLRKVLILSGRTELQTLLLMSAGVATAAAVALALGRRRLRPARARRCGLALAAFVVFVVPAALLDASRYGENPLGWLVEEVLELNAALALLIGVARTPVLRHPRGRPASSSGAARGSTRAASFR